MLLCVPNSRGLNNILCRITVRSDVVGEILMAVGYTAPYWGKKLYHNMQCVISVTLNAVTNSDDALHAAHSTLPSRANSPPPTLLEARKLQQATPTDYVHRHR